MSTLALAMASAHSILPKIILRAFLCMDSKRSSRYAGNTAQTGEAQSMIDLTKLQYTSTKSAQFNPAFLRERKAYSRSRALLYTWSQCSFQNRACEIMINPNNLLAGNSFNDWLFNCIGPTTVGWCFRKPITVSLHFFSLSFMLHRYIFFLFTLFFIMVSLNR